MSCNHEWYQISREYSNRQLAWCELCGTIKWTKYYYGERKPEIVFSTPKNIEAQKRSAAPTNNAMPKFPELEECLVKIGMPPGEGRDLSTAYNGAVNMYELLSRKLSA